ncbi:MAG: hypothetical protein AAGI66_07035 [Cyanobacteria bacterium P01_H01_bin.74]
MAKKSTSKLNFSPTEIETIESAALACIEKKLQSEALLQDLKSQDLKLIDCVFEKEHSSWFLRVYVDNNAGITLDQCATVSQSIDEPIEQVMDQLPFAKDIAYSLEVSSPGLFRALRKQRELPFFLGKPIRVERLAADAKSNPAGKEEKKWPRKHQKTATFLPGAILQSSGMLASYVLPENSQEEGTVLPQSSVIGTKLYIQVKDTDDPVAYLLTEEDAVFLNHTIHLPKDPDLDNANPDNLGPNNHDAGNSHTSNAGVCETEPNIG